MQRRLKVESTQFSINKEFQIPIHVLKTLYKKLKMQTGLLENLKLKENHKNNKLKFKVQL